jgi:CheY-like chemotaxis protein
MHTNQTYLIYVDDDLDDIEIFKEYFGHLDDIAVVTFSSGTDLLEYLSIMPREHYPCIIVLDINIPKMNGWEIAAALKANESWQDIPLVMFSTSTAMYEKDKLKYHVDVVTKPSSAKEAEGIAEKLLSYCSRTSVDDIG